MKPTLVTLARIALGLALCFAAAPADAARKPHCRALCREAIQDCRASTGNRHCAKDVVADCRADGPDACLAAKARAASCSANCSAFVFGVCDDVTCLDTAALIESCRRDDDTFAACRDGSDRARLCTTECNVLTTRVALCQTCAYQILERCYAGDDGLDVCRQAAAEDAACRETCAPLCPDGSEECLYFEALRCHRYGEAYCTAPETVNDCNRVVAEDHRNQPVLDVSIDATGTLQPVERPLTTPGCFLVSAGTVVENNGSATFGARRVCWYDRELLACLTDNAAHVFGGTPGNEDTTSPFAQAQDRKTVRFTTPGIYPYWTFGGDRGAVIVE
jgi:hypothetical protein